jgi:hypothetical protein
MTVRLQTVLRLPASLRLRVAPGFVAFLAAMVVSEAMTANAAALPTHVGACSVTTVKQIETRLEGMPGSGSAISYDNGGYQVSYDTIPAIQASRAGDSIRLCLVSIPKHCPPDDARGRIYRAINLRSGGTWTAADAEHSCGGA